MNKSDFYKSLRRRGSGVFGTSLSQAQVNGVEAIIADCQKHGADLGQAAYILATAYGETGGKMRPVRENMNYSAKRIPQVFSAKRRQGIPASKLAGNPQLLANTVYGGPWGEANLGNRIGTNDGWVFRGFWIGQITGYHNATKWSAGLGVDLIGNPKLLDDPALAVKGLVLPMLEGWATGKSLHQFVSGSKRNFVGARAVWNGSFEAEKYARYARAFEVALTEAGYTYAEARGTVAPETPSTPPAAGILAAIIAFIAALTGKATK
jgi:putative chitinase